MPTDFTLLWPTRTATNSLKLVSCLEAHLKRGVPQESQSLEVYERVDEHNTHNNTKPFEGLYLDFSVQTASQPDKPVSSPISDSHSKRNHKMNEEPI